MHSFFESKVRHYTIRNGRKYYCVTIPSELDKNYAEKEIVLYESGNGLILISKERLLNVT